MRLVFAGPATYWSYCSSMKVKVQNFLSSQLYKEQISVIDEIGAANGYPKSLIIDSGAFTAWNSGKVVTRDEYYKHILEIKNRFGTKISELYFVNLDVIPGSRTRSPSTTERVDAADEGWKNYLWFKERDINTIHVYHQHEDISILKRMIDSGCSYVGISPENTSLYRFRWLEHAFKHIDEKITKCHGFGVTAQKLVTTFPWFSVDSTSYILSGAMGKFFVFCPEFGNVMYDFQHSDRTSKIFSWKRNKLQDYLLTLGSEYILDDIKNSPKLRCQINVLAFLNFEKYCNEKNILSLNYKKQTSIADFLL